MLWNRPQFSVILTTIFCLMLLSHLPASSEGKRSRAHAKKNSGNSRYALFNQNKHKDHYDNPNGAVIEKASHFDYEFYLGHKIVFVCVARGFPRPKITWFKDGIEIFGHPYVQISEWLRDERRIKSKLEIDPARQMDSGNYECQADNKYAIDQRTFRADFSSLTS
ncbi:immunoglobulin domain-containing protein oig-4 [Galendromus occidentalis]|uniref:Immunoglobulin domain-containing protein oig-4 n=1 Tax=Galendromus occidentalis TaxID=34638 RepID=A0AAJ6VWK4_9ACAR|nr:immunoglobulin domain-containing protein oig-4 [Galendromus occidentalis]